MLKKHAHAVISHAVKALTNMEKTIPRTSTEKLKKEKVERKEAKIKKGMELRKEERDRKRSYEKIIAETKDPRRRLSTAKKLKALANKILKQEQKKANQAANKLKQLEKKQVQLEEKKKKIESEAKHELKNETKAKESKKRKRKKQKEDDEDGHILFPIDSHVLQERWTYYLRWLRIILMDVTAWRRQMDEEKEHKAITDKGYFRLIKGFNLFTLCPQRRFGVSHVRMDKACLLALLSEAGNKVADETIEKRCLFRQHFDIASHERRGKAGLKDKIFAGSITTDGIAVSIGLKDNDTDGKIKKKRQQKGTKIVPFKKLNLTEKDEVISVDPGRTDIVYAVKSGDWWKPSECKEEKSEKIYSDNPTRRQMAKEMSHLEDDDSDKEKYVAKWNEKISLRELNTKRRKSDCPVGMSQARHKWTQKLLIWKEKKQGIHITDMEMRTFTSLDNELAKEPPHSSSNHQRNKWSRRLRSLWRTLLQQQQIPVTEQKEKRNRKQIRKDNTVRFSNREYQHLSKTRQRLKKRAEWYAENPKLHRAYREIATRKVATIAEFVIHLAGVQAIFGDLWAVKTMTRERRLDFAAHMDTSSALDMICQRLLSMRSSKDKRLVIAFGAAVFNKSKGGRCPPTKKLKHRLKHRWKEECIVIEVNEHCTSKYCSNPSCKEAPELTQAQCQNATSIYSLKACSACQTIWNRDCNAARNILHVFLHMQDNQGARPFPFNYPSRL